MGQVASKAASVGARKDGTIAGKPAEIQYMRHPDQQQLVWRDKKTGNTTSLDRENIIGVFAKPEKTERSASILYVEPPPQAKDGEEQEQYPTFKTVYARNLPQDFIDDFRIGGALGKQQMKQKSSGAPDVHVVVSTLSGIGLAPGFYEKIVKPMLQHLELKEGVDYALHKTESANSVSEIISSTILPRANEGTKQMLILLSGDGGIVDTVNGLLTKDHSPQYKAPLMAIVPMGTGNALANSSGIITDNTFGLSTIARGKPHNLPVFRTTFSHGSRLVVNEGAGEEEIPTDKACNMSLFGAVVCSWAMHAGLVADSDTAEYRKHGVARFQKAAKDILYPSDGSAPHAYCGKVSILKQDVPKTGNSWTPINTEEHMYVLATLVSNLEKTFRVSPRSKPLEGQLRLVHIGKVEGGGDEIMKIITPAYHDGGHVNDERVQYEAINGLMIEFNEDDEKWRRVCVDGKIVKVEKDGWMQTRMEDRKVADIMALI